MGCCYKNKGWQIDSQVVYHADLNRGAFEPLGRFNINIENTGTYDIKIGTMRIFAGTCKDIGINDMPCGKTFQIEWDVPDGTTPTADTCKAVVTYYNLVEYDCDCDPPAPGK